MAMTVKQKFVKEYTHLLYNTQGHFSESELSEEACKKMALEESRKISREEMIEYLEL